MAATVIRCPYCASRDGDEFSPMTTIEEGTYVCDNCGHMTIPLDNRFKCPCSKCIQMRKVDSWHCPPRQSQFV